MSYNIITTIKNDEGGETYVNFHYNRPDRPTEGSIAFFTVYESVTYLGWGEEGVQIPYNAYEPLYTVPFLFNKGTLDLMIKSQTEKILELMDGREIFVGVETHYKQMTEI